MKIAIFLLSLLFFNNAIGNPDHSGMEVEQFTCFLNIDLFEFSGMDKQTGLKFPILDFRDYVDSSWAKAIYADMELQGKRNVKITIAKSISKAPHYDILSKIEILVLYRDIEESFVIASMSVRNGHEIPKAPKVLTSQRDDVLRIIGIPSHKATFLNSNNKLSYELEDPTLLDGYYDGPGGRDFIQSDNHVKIQIISAEGKLEKEVEIEKASGHINISEMTTGIYIIMLKSDIGKYHTKMRID